jgi:hypothetical protein
MRVWLGRPSEIKDTQAGPLNLEAAGDRDLEAVEFHGRVEAGGEGLDDPRAEQRLGVAGGPEEGDGRNKDEGDEGDAGRHQPAETAARWGCGLGSGGNGNLWRF